jgi:hypothetical protein
MRFVVRVVEYFIPRFLRSPDHLFWFVAKVRSIAVCVSTKPCFSNFRVVKPIGDSLYVFAANWAQLN